MFNKRKNLNASDGMNVDNTTDDLPGLGDGSGSSQPKPTAEPSLSSVMNVMMQILQAKTRREDEQAKQDRKIEVKEFE